MNPLLNLSVRSGSSKAVRLHLDRTANPDDVDGKGMSLLMIAATLGHDEICRVLLEAGADPHLTNSNGHSALCLAEANGHANAIGAIRQFLKKSEYDELGDRQLLESGNNCGPTAQLEGSDLYSSSEGGWDEEPEMVAPENDSSVFVGADTLLNQIASHSPNDKDDDWTDVYVDLPEFTEFYPEGYQWEDWQQVERKLFLYGITTGHIASSQLEEMVKFAPKDAEWYEELLQGVLEDLGVMVDDPPYDSIHPRCLKEPDLPDDAPEIELAEEAINFLWEKNNPAHDPYWIYMRDARIFPVLTAAEETALCSQAEEGELEILQAALSLPAAVLELVSMVKSIGWNSIAGTLDNGQDNDASVGGNTSELSMHDEEEQRSEFMRRIENVEKLCADFMKFPDGIRSVNESGCLLQAVRGEIAGVRFSGRILFRLAEFIQGYASVPDVNGVGMTMQDCLELRNSVVSGKRKMSEAHCSLTVSNLRLANYFAVRYQYSGLPLSDLVQEANLGLLRAVERFDYRRGYRFSTFATWWIRQSIIRAISDKSRLIRIPVHIEEAIAQVQRATETLNDKEERVNPENIAELAVLPLEKVLTVLALPSETVTLDAIGEDESCFAEVVHRRKEESDPESLVICSNCSEAISKILATLAPKEELIIRLRFGIGKDTDLTLEEIGHRFNVSRERIRQIEKKALEKLRHTSRKTLLEVIAS